MEKNLSYLLQLLEHTKEGDEESLQLLKLQDGFQYNPPAQFDPTKSKHQVKDDLCEMAYLVGAFNKLGLQHCEEKTRTALSYMLYVNNILFDKRSKIMNILDGDGIAKDTLEVVRDLCVTSHMLFQINEMEERRLKNMKEQRKSDDQESKGLENSEEQEEEKTTDDD